LLDDFIVNNDPTVGFNDFLKSLSKD
jgi:hypothetical protein